MNKRQFIAGTAGMLLTRSAFAQPAHTQTVWRFDHLDRIGDAKARPEGNPQLVETGAGKAVRFDGIKDSLFIDQNPLAGFANFSFEAIFHPDGGNEAQRWFHVATTDPKTGLDALPGGTNDPNPRFMFEIRVVGERWYLDGFTSGEGYSQALMFKDKLHPVGKWYVVAQTYDGTTYRTFVNGEQQGEAPLAFKPHGPGHCMVGSRMNHVNYFKGAVYEARFTPHALKPGQLLKLPAGLEKA